MVNTAYTGNATAVMPLPAALRWVSTWASRWALPVVWVGLLLPAPLPAHAQGKEAMVISPAGHVGIGSVSESHKLNVDGDVNIAGNLTISGKATATKGTIPIGLVAMWSGDPANLPAGWALCDGTPIAGKPRTPDLSGRFILGYAGAGGKYASIGEKAGRESIALSIDQMPRHDHGGKTEVTSPVMRLAWSNSNRGNGAVLWDASPRGEVNNSTISHDHKINPQGNAQPVDILPPYYVLAFIMYVGE